MDESVELDAGVKSEIERALRDPYVEKLLVTMATGYRLFSISRQLLLTDTDYSDDVKAGLVHSLTDNLMDTRSGEAKPFDVKPVLRLVKRSVVPFLPKILARLRNQEEGRIPDAAARKKRIALKKRLTRNKSGLGK